MTDDDITPVPTVLIGRRAMTTTPHAELVHATALALRGAADPPRRKATDEDGEP